VAQQKCFGMAMVGFNVGPLDTLIIGHFGDDIFYRSDDPTNTVKALKEGG